MEFLNGAHAPMVESKSSLGKSIRVYRRFRLFKKAFRGRMQVE